MFSITEQAVFWKFFSSLSFVLSAMFVKIVSRDTLPQISILEITAFQSGIALVLLQLYRYWRKQTLFASFSNLRHISLSEKREVVFRGICAALALWLWFEGVKYFSLSLLAIFKLLMPLATLVASWVFLKEPVCWVRLIVLCVSLLGMAIVLQKEILYLYDFPLAHWQIILPGLSIFCFIGSDIFAKKILNAGMSPLDVTELLVTCVAFFLGIAALPFWVWPSFEQWIYLGMIGFSGIAAYASLNKAMELKDLGFLLPIRLVRFAMQTLVGVLFLGEVWTKQMGVGLLLILLSTSYLTLYEREHTPS